MREAMETEATKEHGGGAGAELTSSDNESASQGSPKPSEDEQDAGTMSEAVPEGAEQKVIPEEAVVDCNDGVERDEISPGSVVAPAKEEEDDDDDDDNDDDDDDDDDARQEKGEDEETVTRTDDGEDTADVRKLAATSCDLDVVMAIRTLEAVEKDAHAISGSLCSLLSSLQSALSKVTTSSVNHFQCCNEVAGHVQEAALDAASKGNKFINTCLRVNEEMKGMNNMAAQLKVLRKIVDHLDNQVSRFLPR